MEQGFPASRLGLACETADGSKAHSVATRVTFSRNPFPIGSSRNWPVQMKKRLTHGCLIGLSLAVGAVGSQREYNASFASSVR